MHPQLKAHSTVRYIKSQTTNLNQSAGNVMTSEKGPLPCEKAVCNVKVKDLKLTLVQKANTIGACALKPGRKSAPSVKVKYFNCQNSHVLRECGIIHTNGKAYIPVSRVRRQKKVYATRIRVRVE